jgi:hypothetical protein
MEHISEEKTTIPPQNHETQIPQRDLENTNQKQTIGATKESNIEKPLVSRNSQMSFVLNFHYARLKHEVYFI